jgi:hypothetical protein
MGERKRDDLLAAIILTRDISPVHLFERPAIKVAEAFIADLDDGAASGQGFAHGGKSHGKPSWRS